MRETCVPVYLAAKVAQRVSGEALSAREIEVLQRMAAGKSNKEIGAELFISEGTVKSHVKSIFTKLNVISRTEAVANATRRGLIQLQALSRQDKSADRFALADSGNLDW